MIKVNELRLNNWLMEGEKLCRVILLAPQTILVKYNNGTDSAKLAPEDIDGVALTPALLEQCGFTATGVNNEYELIIDTDVLITVNRHILGGISVQLCVKDNWCGKPVQYLHELQNIYLDLTGNEIHIRSIR